MAVDPLKRYRTLTQGSNFASRFQVRQPRNAEEWSSPDPNQQGDPYWLGRRYSGRSQTEGAYVGRRQEDVRGDAVRAMERYGEFLSPDAMDELLQISETGMAKPRGEGKFINTIQTVDWLGAIVRSGVADLLNASSKEFSWWDAIKASAPWANEAQRAKIPKDLWAEGEMFGFTGSQIMRNLGWTGDDLGTKILRGTAGFAFDVAFDPLTYATWGTAALGKKAAIQAFRESVRAGAKDAIGSTLAKKAATTRGGELIQQWVAKDLDEALKVVRPELERLAKGNPEVLRQLEEEAREAILRQMDHVSALEAGAVTTDLAAKMAKEGVEEASAKTLAESVKESIENLLPWTKEKLDDVDGVVRTAWEKGELPFALRDKQNELYKLIEGKQFKTIRKEWAPFVEGLDPKKAWAAGGMRIALPWGRAKHSSIYIGFATNRGVSAPFRRGIDYFSKHASPGLTNKFVGAAKSFQARFGIDQPLYLAARQGTAFAHSLRESMDTILGSTMRNIENPRVVQAMFTNLQEAAEAAGLERGVVSDMFAKGMDQTPEALHAFFGAKGVPVEIIEQVAEETTNLKALFGVWADAIKSLDPTFEGLDNFFPMAKSRWYDSLLTGMAQSGIQIDNAMISAARAVDEDVAEGLKYLALEQKTKERQGALALTKVDENGHLRPRPNMAFANEHQLGDDTILSVYSIEEILKSGETVQVARTQMNERIGKALNYLQEQRPELFPHVKGQRKDFSKLNAFDMDFPKVYDEYMQTITRYFQYQASVKIGKMMGRIKEGANAINVAATTARVLDGASSIQAERMTPMVEKVAQALDELLGNRTVKTKISDTLVLNVRRMVLENPRVKVAILQLDRFLKENAEHIGTVQRAMEDTVQRLVMEGMPEGMARAFVAASDGPVEAVRRAIHEAVDDAASQTEQLLSAVLAEAGSQVDEVGGRQVVADALAEATRTAKDEIAAQILRYNEQVKFSFDVNPKYVDLTAAGEGGKTPAEGLAHVLTREAKKILREQVERHNPAALPALDKVLSKDEFTLEGVKEAMDAVREGTEKVLTRRAKTFYEDLVNDTTLSGLTWEEAADIIGPTQTWKVLSELYGFEAPEVADQTLKTLFDEVADEVGVNYRPRQSAGYAGAVGDTDLIAHEYESTFDLATELNADLLDSGELGTKAAVAAMAHEHLRLQVMNQARKLQRMGYTFQYTPEILTPQMRHAALRQKIILVPTPPAGGAIAPLFSNVDDAFGMRYIDIFDGVHFAYGYGVFGFGQDAVDPKAITNAWLNHRELFTDVQVQGATIPVQDAFGTLTRGRYLAGENNTPAGPKVILMGDDFTNPEPIPRGAVQAAVGDLGSEGRTIGKGGRETGDSGARRAAAPGKPGQFARGDIDTNAPGFKETERKAKRLQKEAGVDPLAPTTRIDDAADTTDPVYERWDRLNKDLDRQVRKGRMTRDQADRFFAAKTMTGDDEVAYAYAGAEPGILTIPDEPNLGAPGGGLLGADPTLEGLHGSETRLVNQARINDLMEWFELEGAGYRTAELTRKDAEAFRKLMVEYGRGRVSNRYTGGLTAHGETVQRTAAQDVLIDASDELMQRQAGLVVDILKSRQARQVMAAGQALEDSRQQLARLTEAIPATTVDGQVSTRFLPNGNIEVDVPGGTREFGSQAELDEFIIQLHDTLEFIENQLREHPITATRTLRGGAEKPYTVWGRTEDGRRVPLGSGPTSRDAWQDAMGKLERTSDLEEGQYWFRGRTDDDVNLVWENEAPPIQIGDIEFDFDPSPKLPIDVEMPVESAPHRQLREVQMELTDEVAALERATAVEPPTEGPLIERSHALLARIERFQAEVEDRTRSLIELLPEGTVGETLEQYGDEAFQGLDFTHPRLATPHWQGLWDAAQEKLHTVDIEARQAEVVQALHDPDMMWNGNVYRAAPEDFRIGGLADDPARAIRYMEGKEETFTQKGGLLGVRKGDIPEEVLRQTGKDPRFPDDVEYFVWLDEGERVLYDNFPIRVDERVRVTRMKMDNLREFKADPTSRKQPPAEVWELEKQIKAYGVDMEAGIQRYAFEVERDNLPDKVRNVVGRSYDEGGEWVVGNEPLRPSVFITREELAGDFTQSVKPRPTSRQMLANRAAEAVRETEVLGGNRFNMLTQGENSVVNALRSGNAERIAAVEEQLRWWLDRMGLDSTRLVVDDPRGVWRVRWRDGESIEMSLDEVRQLAKPLVPDADGMSAVELLAELETRFGGGIDLPSQMPERLQRWVDANRDGLPEIDRGLDEMRTNLHRMQAELAAIGTAREVPADAAEFLRMYEDWLDGVEMFKLNPDAHSALLENDFHRLIALAREWLSDDEFQQMLRIRDLVVGQRIFGLHKTKALGGLAAVKSADQIVGELTEKVRRTIVEVTDEAILPHWEEETILAWNATVERFMNAVTGVRKYQEAPGSTVGQIPQPQSILTSTTDQEDFLGALNILRESVDEMRSALSTMSGNSAAAIRVQKWLRTVLPPGFDMENLDATAARWFDEAGNFKPKTFIYDTRQYLNTNKVAEVTDAIALGDRGFVDPALYSLGGKGLEGYVIDPLFGVVLENMAYQIRAAYTPYGQTVVAEYARKLQQYWKMASTVLRPSFSPRNFIGGSFNAMAANVGVDDMRWVGVKMARLKAAERRGIRWEEWIVKNMSAQDQEVIRQAMNHGVIGTSFSSTISKEAAKGKPHLAAVNAGAIAMETVEDFLRLATFRHYYRHGVPESAAAAATMALVTQFNYKDLTRIERSIVKYIPFFVWTRNNIPLQFRILMEKPGYANRYQHLMSNITASFDETPDETTWLERQGMPEWMSGLTADLGVTMGKEGLWSRLLLSPDVPLRDLEQLAISSDRGAVGYTQWVAEMVSPLITVPLSFTERGFNDEEWVNAPAGLSWFFRAIPFVNKREIAGEGIQISQRARRNLETAIPFAREWTEMVGVDPNEARRGARLGFDYREPTDAGQRARAAALTLGKGFGFKTTTPSDSIFPTGEGERRIQEIIQEAMLQGIIPQDYRYPGQRR